MNNKNFQQQVNDISPYSQINKAFCHAYGSKAAAVLATLIYKYTYWEKNNGLTPFKTTTGNTLHYFHISKLDITLDSGVSFSSLEKDIKSNPLNMLEDLKLIKKISLDTANKADRFVLFPNRIKAEIKRLSSLFEEDMEMKKKLPRKFERDFFKALRGKMTRDEVYKKFYKKVEVEELNMDDIDDILQDPASIEAENSSNEGKTKNNTKNTLKTLKTTNPSSSNKGVRINNESKTTINELKAGINDYVLDNINIQNLHDLLKNYIPDKKSSNWTMSAQDEEYIIKNLSGVTAQYMTATIDYIDTNVERMMNRERDMRFGSLLAGIFEKVINAGIGCIPIKSNLNNDEQCKIINSLPAEQEFECEDVL